VIALAGAVFVASLLGSAHCAGMCSPFVCFYAGADARASGWGHAAYNGGRLASYLLLGAVAGALGAGVEHVGAGVGVSRAAGTLAGILMIAWGVLTLLALRGVAVPMLAPIAGVQRWMAARLRDVRALPPVGRALTVGLLTTLMPCGWLYAFVITAAGAGSVGGALLLMTVFWAGTLPMMLVIGAGVRTIAGPLRERLPVISALAIVAVGVFSLTGRVKMDPMMVSMRARQMIPASVQASVRVPATGSSTTTRRDSTPPNKVPAPKPPDEHHP
jgi:sulfite exporter TauE/SafE